MVAPVEEGRTPAALVAGQKQIEAVVHPDDDRPEAGPRVELGVEHGELGLVAFRRTAASAA